MIVLPILDLKGHLGHKWSTEKQVEKITEEYKEVIEALENHKNSYSSITRDELAMEIMDLIVSSVGALRMLELEENLNVEEIGDITYRKLASRGWPIEKMITVKRV